MTTGDRANERDTAPRTDGIQAEIEARLAATEPEVEVLAADVMGSRGSPMLRIYIDHPGGVDLELCARITHQLRDLLREYTVEVSSPGPERPLTKLDHYRRYLGRRVRVRDPRGDRGRKDFKGELISADDRVWRWQRSDTITIPHERTAARASYSNRNRRPSADDEYPEPSALACWSVRLAAAAPEHLEFWRSNK